MRLDTGNSPVFEGAFSLTPAPQGHK